MIINSTPIGLGLGDALLSKNYSASGIYNYLDKNEHIILISKKADRGILVGYNIFLDIFKDTENNSSIDLYDILRVIAVTQEPNLMKDKI